MRVRGDVAGGSSISCGGIIMSCFLTQFQMPQNTPAANGADPAALAQSSGATVATSVAPVYDPTSGFVLFFDYIVGLLPKHEKITLVFQVRALMLFLRTSFCCERVKLNLCCWCATLFGGPQLVDGSTAKTKPRDAPVKDTELVPSNKTRRVALGLKKPFAKVHIGGLPALCVCVCVCVCVCTRSSHSFWTL
jgi:hypothetical protein